MLWMSEAEEARAASRIADLLRALIADAPVLGIRVERSPNGATIVDCGVEAIGSWEAGRRIAVLAHGGMMNAHLGLTDLAGIPLPELVGESWLPMHSAYQLQLSFPLDEVDPAIRVSGPIRARIDRVKKAATPPEAQWNPWAAAVVESNALPTVDVIKAIARRAALPPEALTLVVTPTHSLAGVTQIAGRLNESVLFTLDQGLGLDPACVISILGAVPIAPVGGEAPPIVTQDDMIHYAGRATMVVDAPSSWNLDAVAAGLTFGSSAAHGRLFSEILAEAGGVFERIPGLADLNKIARISVVDRRSGRMATAGATDAEFLAAALRRTAKGRDA
jgi:methenyltetrahydromethanopterin cyclohydrolase